MIANMVYASGQRVDEPDSLQQTFRALRTPGQMAWIALDRADEDHLARLADGRGLHELAVDDAVEGGERTLVEADRALRDVLDHAVRLDERIEGMRLLMATVAGTLFVVFKGNDWL